MLITPLTVPHDALVIPVGAAASGKSTFARTHFLPSEIVSSDEMRERISDDATNQKVSKAAFEVFHLLIQKRLELGRLTVADATNVRAASRKTLRDLAAKYQRPTVVLYMNSSLSECKDRNRARGRYVPEDAIEGQWDAQVEAYPALTLEGYDYIHVIDGPASEYRIHRLSPEVVPIAPGFDVIGDIHGCPTELLALLQTLGYSVTEVVSGEAIIRHPEERKVVLVGDITDRGPDSVTSLRLLRSLLGSGHYAVQGNHDNKLRRALNGNKITMDHGLEETMRQIREHMDEEETARIKRILDTLPYTLTLRVPGEPDLVIAHAGIPNMMIGRTDRAAQSHALYGEVLGFENGLPIRGTSWHASWPTGKDQPMLVHGHTVTDLPFEVRDHANVINVDTGAVFGGKLTAYRWPEDQIVQVAVEAPYASK